jgi:uncharacterized protein (DUF1800 family)
VLASLSNINSQDGPKEIIGQGQSSGVIISSSSNNEQTQNTIESYGFLPNECNASRFLSHATFGPAIEDINHLTSVGFEKWFDEQFAIPFSKTLKTTVSEYHQIMKDSTGNDNITPNVRLWDYAWWQYHMTSDDVLRQRIAFALSEIFVISRISSFGNNAYALSDFYDILLKHSFGNYRDLLEEITYHPSMGVYLTSINNPKTDTTINRFPDENYAREIMQLFSIGLYELNLDGSYKIDTASNPIATYDNEDIQEFAKIFTGLMWGDRDPVQNQFFKNALNFESYTVPMQMLNLQHEPGEKYLLNDSIVPNRDPVDGDLDIQDAIDNLFYHENTGPFICKLLIQRLVTSNPKPDYIERIATVFNDNGEGVRGDLKAVIKAILIAPEATDCDAEGDLTFGKLKEPFLRYVHLARAFHLTTDSGKYRNAMNDVYARVSQRPLNSPTVFNFYQPDYQPLGEIAEQDLVAPEFQIAYTFAILGFMNGVNRWIVLNKFADEYSLFSGEVVPADEKSYLDLSDELLYTNDDKLIELLDRISLILAHGQIENTSLSLILKELKKYPNNTDAEKERRIRTAIYLISVIPDYLINN